MAGSDAIHLRDAKTEDCEMIWKWRNHPEVHKYFFAPEPVSWPIHQKWFAAKLCEARTLIFIAQVEDADVGVIRFEDEGTYHSVSVNVAPDHFGKGYGSEIIALGSKALFEEEYPPRRILAEVKHGNEASRKAFLKAGYSLKEDLADMWVLERRS